ncbi:hypothetical protein SCHPADRAFT_906076 [Schizopora paradoxa]|uniref:Uncharacterized protein n=1 Tax=Schizopora paradoxa TaxID=27342 RepID=A0A0H2RPE4_9AGAM|nr:hypothetical protein SCHPADRAFT_906076 [Schizopora paradoxa]
MTTPSSFLDHPKSPMPAHESAEMLSNHDDLPLMRTPTLEGLPIDVHDHLLCMLPDEETLKAAVLSCKPFHEAYKSRKESIDKEVFDNRKAIELLIMQRTMWQILDVALDTLKLLNGRGTESENRESI